MQPDSNLFSTHAEVDKAWIDFNGHMNMGYYVVAFDWIATDRFYDSMGIGVADKELLGCSTFTLGCNVDYIQELLQGDPLLFTSQLVDFDHKRLHYFHRLYHAEKGYLAATNECLGMYVNMETRRSTAFSDTQMQRFQLELERGQALGTPEGFGRTLGIRR